jgi:hypothetical protein
MPLEDLGGGAFHLGRFSINVPLASYRLSLMSRFHSVDYEGEFAYQNGRWVAKQPLSTYACWK